MIAYQLGTAIRELVSLRLRVVLLILQLVVVAGSLSASLNDTFRSLNNVALARELDGRDVSYFTIFYDDAQPPDINERMAAVLAEVLDGRSSDYSIIKNNYFGDEQLVAPLLVGLGGFAQVYGVPANIVQRDAVFIGSDVQEYEPGSLVNIGGRERTVDGRLPAGASYLDPWMSSESLDDMVLLLSTYGRFAEENQPGVWQQEVVGRAFLFDPADTLIDGYSQAAASTGGIEVVPQQLHQRTTDVYEAQLRQSSMFLIFFSSLLVVLLGTIVATVDALLASNLRRYTIERLYGASNLHVMARVNMFLAAVVSVPSLLIFVGFAAITPHVGEVVPFVAIALAAVHLILSIRVMTTLRQTPVTGLLRRE